jgi:hypothetical protein
MFHQATRLLDHLIWATYGHLGWSTLALLRSGTRSNHLLLAWQYLQCAVYLRILVGRNTTSFDDSAEFHRVLSL